jgi:molybdopterin-guanine dinucleotide biosynthesis protein A
MCEEILVVGRGGPVSARCRHVPDLRSGREGPLAGIEAGLSAARHRCVFVAAGDLPFLPSDLVGHLLGLLSARVLAAVPFSGGRLHPLCAAYDRELRPAVSAALDRNVRSARGLLEGLSGVRYVEDHELWHFGDPELLLMNVNSPEDLARARAAFHEGVVF